LIRRSVNRVAADIGRPRGDPTTDTGVARPFGSRAGRCSGARVTHQRLKRCGFIGTVISIALPPFAASAAEPVRSVDIVEASAFLEGYRGASEAHSPDFYDLYSDRAVVHVRIQDRERGIAFQGRAFKAWGASCSQKADRPLTVRSFMRRPSSSGGPASHSGQAVLHGQVLLDLSYQVGIEREGPRIGSWMNGSRRSPPRPVIRHTR